MDKRVIRQRLRMLRTAMREMGLDYYLVPTADFHNSEYVSEYFKIREYLSGFTGSNGTLVISQEEAGLWTDGRYFVQAERELEDTGIRLYRMQEEGVPDIVTYLRQHMWEGQSLGFDGRAVSADFGKRLEEAMSEKKIRICFERDIADMVWQNRPPFPCSRAEVVPPRLCGESVSEKLARVREKMKEKKASCLFLSKLDDLMWLFNLRGNDVTCNPVVMCYGFITEREAWIFLQSGALQRETISCMQEAGVQIRDYWVLIPFLQDYFLAGNRGVLLYDSRNINYTMYRIFRSYGRCKESVNPAEQLKAVKTEKELEFIRKVYLKDSIAVTKFIYWVKRAVKEQVGLTEYSAARYLGELRRAIPEFLDASFPTICAYMENAAMMHYEAVENSCSMLEADGMLLVDSGGQYLGGTTDVTRTIVLGDISGEMKEHFTAVTAGMLRLASARFLYGCTGRNLDILARGPLWDMDMDYKCGTGHGVGYMLSVHEGPQNIRWKYVEDMPEAVLEEGMLVTDEPGVYLEGKYGIRTENVLEVVKGMKNEDGQFMRFCHLTWVPIDLDAILPDRLAEKEREALNWYHREVRERISPYLTKEEQDWLAEVTREV